MTRQLNGLTHVEGQRFREDPGLCYEDFEEGDIYEHWPGRTITETDNIWFTNLTMNTHPLHFDLNYAGHSEFGKPLVNSAFTLSLVIGMTVSSTSQKAIANLGWEEIKLPAPVFVGDTLYAETEVLGKRESKSRPTAGIVRVRHSGKNQDGDYVLHMTRSFLATKRGHSVVDAVRDKMS
jgi:acyl dehydratase